MELDSYEPNPEHSPVSNKLLKDENNPYNNDLSVKPYSAIICRSIVE